MFDDNFSKITKCSIVVEFFGGPRDGDALFWHVLEEHYRKLLPKPPSSYSEDEARKPVPPGEIEVTIAKRLRLEWWEGKYIAGRYGQMQ